MYLRRKKISYFQTAAYDACALMGGGIVFFLALFAAIAQIVRGRRERKAKARKNKGQASAVFAR